MSEQDQVQDLAINESQDQELEINLDDSEDVELLKQEIEKERTAKAQILARAKKAEAELKATKQSKTDAPQQINNQAPSNTSDDVDVKILKAQGTSQDEIEYLKKIAAVNGTSVIDARNDELFIAFKAKKEADEKAQKAKLGASRGSGTVKKDAGFNTQGLSQEEHRRLWRESQGLN